jgi:hypothetical protein
MPATPIQYPSPDGQHFGIACEQRPGYLLAEVSGPKGSIELSVAYWQVLAQEVARRNAHRLMVVDRLVGPSLPPEGLLEVIDRLVGSGLQDVRIAYVEPAAEHVPAMEHGQIFAAEKGFNARVFGEICAADRWLRLG